MIKGLWLRFGGGRSGEGSLCFRRTRGMRQKWNFVWYASSQVGEGFLDVGRIVVGFFGVLIATSSQWASPWIPLGLLRDCEQLLVHLLQGVHSLLELNIFRRKLCLVQGQTASASQGYGLLPCPLSGRVAPWRCGLSVAQKVSRLSSMLTCTQQSILRIGQQSVLLTRHSCQTLRTCPS